MAAKKPGKKVIAKKPETIAKLSAIAQKLIAYVDDTEIPVLAEFCHINKISKQAMYKNQELVEAIEYLMTKKESQLEKMALTGAIDKTMAIFSLKQMGWKAG